MKRFKVKLKGTTPLLQHRMTEEQLFGLLGAKSSRKKDKEEQTPRQIADQYAYRDTLGNIVIPTSYISGAFRSVASDYKQKNSIRKSLKSVCGGIFRPEGEFAPLHQEDGTLIRDFEVDVRKATNHQKGAVAICRPRFDSWECTFTVSLDEDLISPEVALQILNDAGKRSGIGSFRVSKGGYFGQFIATEWKELS